jgi:GntR family transcriptional repressor for pyruvate dehydrogenase complex
MVVSPRLFQLTEGKERPYNKSHQRIRKARSQMKKNASDQVVEYIQKRIQSGEWRPGTKISTEVQLQRETGFGKATIREAVEKLVAMDILKKRQGDGTYVNDFSVGSIFSQMVPEVLFNAHDSVTILEFREVVEPASVQMFVEHFEKERYELLKKYLEQMRQHQDDTDNDIFYESDRDFHLEIARGTRNSILIKVMEILNGTMTQYHYTANRTIGSKSGVMEHEGILEAIGRRDGELGALLMRRHLQRSKKDMLEYMKRK